MSAEDREEVGDFDDAQVRKLKLVDDDDDDTQQLHQAVEAVKAKIAADPNNGELHAELAQLYHNLDQDDDAEASYTKAIELNPANVAFYQQKAAFFVAVGDNKEAQAVLLEGLAKDPNNAAVLYDLGCAFVDENPAQAQQYFDQAVQKDGHHVLALIQLARFASESKRPDDALNLYQRVIAVDASNVPVLSAAGQILQDKKTADEVKKASVYFAQAVALDPSDVQLRARLIQCYDALGAEAEREQARADLHNAFRSNTLNPSYKVRPRFCCGQFEAGDKYVMAFDHSVPEGPNKIKYTFNGYKKGEVHEDKVLVRVTLEHDGSKYNLVSSKPDRTVEASFDAEPAYQIVKEQAAKIISA